MQVLQRAYYFTLPITKLLLCLWVTRLPTCTNDQEQVGWVHKKYLQHFLFHDILVSGMVLGVLGPLMSWLASTEIV